MPAALSDTQNRYLALAWLCVDADPKVSTSLPIARSVQQCAKYLECKAVQRNDLNNLPHHISS